MFNKLKVLMFLEYSIFASLSMNSYYFMNYLNLNGFQIGLLMSTFGLGMLISSFFTSKIVNKKYSEKELYTFYLIITALSFICISFTTNFYILLTLFTINSLFLAPTMGLSNSITFHFLDKKEDYGKIRVWGTIGFLVSAWFFGFIISSLFEDKINYMYISSALICLMLIFHINKYIPNFNEDIKEENHNQFKITNFFKNKILLFLVFIDLNTLILQKFFHIGLGTNLSYLKVEEKWVLPIITSTQFIEVFVLFSLSYLLTKIAKINMVILGVVLHFIIFYIISYQNIYSVIIAAAMCGFIYPMILVTAQMIVDNNVEEKYRASMHQIYLLLTIGIADLFGNWIAGIYFEYLKVSEGNFDIWWTHVYTASFIFLAISMILKIVIIKGKYNE